MRALALLFLAVLSLAPAALAARQISVGTTEYFTVSFPAEEVIPDDYAFSFLNPPFIGQETGNGSIQSFGLEVGTDYGFLNRDDPAREQITTIQVQNATTAVTIRYESRAQRHFGGFFSLDQDVFLNDTLAHESRHTEFHPFAGLRYQTSAILAFEQNASAFVRISPDVLERRVFPGGSLLYIDPHDGGDFFSGKTSFTRYYLANLTGPVSLTVSTEYPRALPLELHLSFRFEDATATAAREAGEACGGAIKDWVRNVLGTCPSIEGLVKLTVAGFDLILGIVLGTLWGEDGRDIAAFISRFVGEILGAVLLTMRLLAVNPVRTLVVYESLLFGFGLAMGGILRDPMMPLTALRAGNLPLLHLALWWFTFLFECLRFAAGHIASIISLIVSAIRGS